MPVPNEYDPFQTVVDGLPITLDKDVIKNTPTTLVGQILELLAGVILFLIMLLPLWIVIGVYFTARK